MTDWGLTAGDLLDRIDATVDGLCACGCGRPLGPSGPSGWFISEACQTAYHRQGTIRPGEVRGSTGAAAGPARWRPDLVDMFDDPDLELLDRHHRDDTGLNYCVYTRRSNPAVVHLRVDDGHRFVGLDVGRTQPWASGPSEAFRRLERELTNRRRLNPDPVSQPANSWSEVLGRMGEAFDREVLGDRAREARLPTVAEQAAAYADLVAAGTVFWLPDPPANPEAPTMADLAGGVDLTPAGAQSAATWADEAAQFVVPREPRLPAVGDRITLHWSNPGGDQVTELAVSEVAPDGTVTTEPVDRSGSVSRFRRLAERVTDPHGYGLAGAAAFGGSAWRQVVAEAAQAESDRVALRALCSNEAERERALRAARDHGLTVREVAEMLAAGQALGPEGFSTSALDHLMDGGAIDTVGVMATVPPPSGEDIMDNIGAFSEQLADYNPAVRFNAGAAVVEALRAQAPPNRAPHARLGGLGDVPIVLDATLMPEEWRLEFADGQRMESHVCAWEPIERASSDWMPPWRRVSRYRCSLRWSDGFRCDSTTIDGSTVRRTERLVVPPAPEAGVTFEGR